AVLALPQEHFVKDFADQASRDSFERLLAGAADVVEAPAMAPERQIADYGEPRNHQYAWVGAYLARHAHVLIALWDGAPARGTGGTAEVVSWFIKNKVPDRYAISFAPAAKRVPGVRRELVHINPASRSVEVRAV
ncbi:MAG: hypothetical protein KDJ41_17860, partial [Hyphomicrobiaceae bacterium]|nr:hypothetical protein [Hyphomicrobiaceae bacterium]